MFSEIEISQFVSVYTIFSVDVTLMRLIRDMSLQYNHHWGGGS